MKKAFSVLAVAALVAGIGYKVAQDPWIQGNVTLMFSRVEVTDPRANTTVSPANTLVAPVVANDFFSAFCAGDAAYLAANTGGAIAMTEEDLASYFASRSLRCFAFRYLGSLTPTPGIQQYVYVIDAGEQGELWYVLTVEGGVAVNLE